VQLLTSKTGFRYHKCVMTFKDVHVLKTIYLFDVIISFREFEQQRELRERGLQTTSDKGTHDESADSKESSPDQNVNNHINKVSHLLSFTSIIYFLSSAWLEGHKAFYKNKNTSSRQNTYIHSFLILMKTT